MTAIKKHLALSFCVFALLGTLASCGGNSPSDDESGDTLRPAAADFTVTDTERGYSGKPVSVTVKANPGKSTGKITIWYAGSGKTTYNRTTDPPTDKGDYVVTFDVEPAGNYTAARRLYAGILRIGDPFITMTTTFVDGDNGRRSLSFNGTGEAVIDWGDGAAPEIFTLNTATAWEHIYTDITTPKTIRIISYGTISRLDCSKNKLTSLDVSENSDLTLLNCWNTQLTSLDVSGNPALTYLDCSNNKLISLDVSENSALEELYCSINQLTSLDVSGNPALEELQCYSNQLTSLNASGIPALKYLSCHNNQLISLNASGNSALLVLYCQNNQLISLNASGNSALRELYCYDNQLTSLNVSGNPALLVLFCYNNRFNREGLVPLFESLPSRAGKTQGRLCCNPNPGYGELTAGEKKIAADKDWLFYTANGQPEA